MAEVDNPIPMDCGAYDNRPHPYAQGCHRDAFWVLVVDGEAVDFRCFECFGWSNMSALHRAVPTDWARSKKPLKP